MSDKLMDTEPGGESTQYESIKTVTLEHKKESGQLEGSSDRTQGGDTSQSSIDNKERGEKTAENIRYGQALSEQGMGGQTTTSSGSANQGGGFGGTEDTISSQDSTIEKERVEQGYGGKQDMDGTVGA